MKATLRNETESDAEPIAEITKAAFADCPHGNHTEQFIVAALRKAGALSVSLVAEVNGEVVGHVAFSPVTLSDGGAGWYGLGPVSVRPDVQRKGIGSSLIRQGLCRLRELGANGCILVGEPAFYTRLGFRNLPDLTIDGVPPENILALPFDEHGAKGSATFHEAFTAEK